MLWQPEPAPKLWPVILRLARAGITRSPNEEESWIALGGAIAQFGDLYDAVACITEATLRFPVSWRLKILLGRAHYNLGRFDEARRQARSALELSPRDVKALILHFEASVSLGDIDESEQFIDGVHQICPSHWGLLELCAKRGDFQALLTLADSLLARNQGYTSATYYRSFALAKLKRQEPCQTISLNRFIQISNLPSPIGYESSEIYRGTLADEIRRNPTLVVDPKGKTTSGGLQTLRLRQPNARAVETLIAEIKKTVEQYLVQHSGDEDSFFYNCPHLARLEAWGVIYSSTGHQESHYHPSGWLSGVYFVDSPEGAPNFPRPGALILGALADDDCSGSSWTPIEVEPIPGRIVLFPSYLPHATRPLGRDGTRISIAFDVMPIDDDRTMQQSQRV
jgi:uncharacterized protein (TIGR02466 family)